MPQNTYCSVVAMIAVCIAASVTVAADDPSTAGAGQPRPCNECGMIYNIRRVEMPVAPERATLPNITSSPLAGGMGSSTQPVPLLSFGSGGPHRVQREPSTRSAWEITIRYDNGRFGFLGQDNEPEFMVGDRVRVVEHVIEVLGQPAR